MNNVNVILTNVRLADEICSSNGRISLDFVKEIIEKRNRRASNRRSRIRKLVPDVYSRVYKGSKKSMVKSNIDWYKENRPNLP